MGNASPTQSMSLSSFHNFGDVAAEDDAVLDYFLSTNAVQRIQDNKVLLVLGRKGTGKTAIVRYITEGSNDPMARALNLRDYPWNIHASRVDRGASDIEAYVSSWRYLIAVELATMVLAKSLQARQIPDYKMLEAYLTDNYGGVTPRSSDILRPQKQKTRRIVLRPVVLGNALGEIEMARTDSDHQLGFELNVVSQAIIAAAVSIAAYSFVGPLSLHFDELDQGMSKMDEQRSRMLIGLILAARETRRETETYVTPVSPVVYLRTDLWDDLDFSDKNKISMTTTLNLEWNGKTLLDLINARLRAKLSADATWETVVSSDLVRGSQTKWNHLLARTFRRPRDMISFLNVTLREAKKRNEEPTLLINKDIVASREEYSVYLKKELDDEIRPHWPKWEEAIQACSALGTISFERADFEREYEQRRSHDNDVGAGDALALLYRFSAIGYLKRSGYGGSSWTFHYMEPEAGWDVAAKRFSVHLGLKEYAKLRESRA